MFDAASLVAEMFPDKDFEEVYKSVESVGVDETIQRFLSTIILPKKSKDLIYTIETSRDTAMLEELFPHIAKESLENILAANGGNVDLAALSLSKLKSERSDNLKRLQEIFPLESNLDKILAQNGDSIEEACIFLSTEIEQRTWTQSLFPVQPLGFTSGSSLSSKPNFESAPIINANSSLSSDVLRGNAKALLDQRSELYSKASNAHERGSLTGYSTSSYYSSEAQKLTHQIEVLNNQAATNRIKENDLHQGPSVLDLHGLYVEEAKKVMESRLTEKWLKVITGSKRGAGVLMPALRSLARIKGWKVRNVETASFEIKL